MPGNRGVAYKGPGKVEVVDLEYPELTLKDGPGVNPANVGRQVPHGAILKSVSTNICCSDQHMVRGRTRAPAGVVLGHEITGRSSRWDPVWNSSKPVTCARYLSTLPSGSSVENDHTVAEAGANALS